MGHRDAAGHRAEYVERDSQRVLAFRGGGPWRVHVCQPADVREPAGGDRIRRTGERRDLDRGCGSLAALRLRALDGSVLRRPAAGTNGPRRGDHRRPGVPNPSSPRLLHRRAEVTATQAGEARAGVEVRLEDLRRSYAGVTALDGLSLTLAPGQRVALARALAIRPQVLLLDEPLSALDAKVRSRLRDEIRRVQLEVGITTLFVTHDQEEALAIADRVGVMQSGRLEQLGPPTEIYSRPAT